MEREIVDLINSVKTLLDSISVCNDMNDDYFVWSKTTVEKCLKDIEALESEESESYYYSDWCAG